MFGSFSRTAVAYGPSHPLLERLGYWTVRSYLWAYARACRFHEPSSGYARERAASFRARLERGAPVYLIGVGVGGHNSGTALVEATPRDGIRVLANNEEERYTQIKHCTLLPEHSVAVLRRQMDDVGVRADEVHAFLGSWNYVEQAAFAAGEFFSELPFDLPLLSPKANAVMNGGHLFQGVRSPAWLSKQLGLAKTRPLIGLRHHDSHAYFSYGVSPFARCGAPVMIAVIDGAGDDGSISLYVAKGNELKLLFKNDTSCDSPAMLYGQVSSALGGWTFMSSEGRYMGAAAWGNNNRHTNPFYHQLRQLIYFAPQGRIYVNRRWANWQRAGALKPFSRELDRVIGPAVPLAQMWNPDAILNVENVEHSPITRERVDKAAALQMLYEDMLFHLLSYWLVKTGASRLVLSGGGALNCVANMRLLENFDEAFYERYLGRARTRLHLWVPPTPGDAGMPMGAAYHFAMRHGAAPGEPLQHAFYCGLPPTSAEIRAALEASPEIGSRPLDNVSGERGRARVADLAAYIVSRGGVVGLFQGAAETGPRALGHRSILANPCDPAVRENLNRRVKFRELVRPLAPMATLAAAKRWFKLSAGAEDDDYNAYNYMILTAPARPEAHQVIPAVIHADGTGRVQIVRPETDPFTFAYLQAMGRRVGVEVSVNTSLNVGSPIVQTPAQALECLRRSHGMTALLMIGADGPAWLVWHHIVRPPKDQGEQLLHWFGQWEADSSELSAAS